MQQAFFMNASWMKVRRSNRKRLKGSVTLEGSRVRARDEKDEISLSWLALSGRNHPLRGALLLSGQPWPA